LRKREEGGRERGREGKREGGRERLAAGEEAQLWEMARRGTTGGKRNASRHAGTADDTAALRQKEQKMRKSLQHRRIDT